MKRYQWLTVILLASVGMAYSQDFPAEEVWSCDLQARSAILGMPWTDTDGNLFCFLKDPDRMMIVRNGEIEWEGALPEGQVVSGTYVDFGLEDGPRLLVATVLDSVGQIVEYYGDEYQNSIVHRPPFLCSQRAGDENNGSESDNRSANVLLPLRRNEPDTSRTIIIGTWSTGSSWDNFWPSSSSSRSGSIATYSLATDSGGASFISGYCMDYQVVDLEEDGDAAYLFGCNVIVQHDDSYSGIGTVYAVNNRFEVTTQMYIGGYQGNYFRVFPRREGGRHKIVGVGCRNNADRPGGVPNIYWSNWPTETPDVEVDSMWYGRVVDYESPEDHQRYALLPRGNQVLIFSVDNFEVAGQLVYRSNFLDMRSVVSRGGISDKIIGLFSDRISLFRLGSLNVNQEIIFLTSSSQTLSSYPNPFNSSTTITYTLPKSGWTVVDVMDIQGRLVERLSGGWKAAGSYREVWDGGGVVSGEYILRLKRDNIEFSRIITFIK